MRRTRKRKPDYAKRNRVLAKLGYVSYQAYLRGELWRSLRESQIKSEPACQLCRQLPSRKATQVHHLSYSIATLSGDTPWKLVSACASCHMSLEFTKYGTKRDQDAVRKKTIRRLKSLGRYEKHTRPREDYAKSEK